MDGAHGGEIMPVAPRPRRPPGRSRAATEKSWASRQDGSHALYNLWIWRRPGGLRDQVLARDPLCVMCLKEGRTEASTRADHIVPHKGDYDRFVDVDGCQGLCESHHNAKSRREQLQGTPG